LLKWLYYRNLNSTARERDPTARDALVHANDGAVVKFSIR
jgi:hypothetical protein